MKSFGKRSALRLTCSFSRLVVTPYRAASSASSRTLRPRSTTMARVTSSIDMREVRERVDTGSGRLGLTARISPRPADDPLTRLDQVFDLPLEPQRPDERKGANVGVGKVRLQPRRCGEQRPSLRDDIVDQHDSPDHPRRPDHGKRLVVLVYRRALAAERGCGLADRELTLQPRPYRAGQADVPERDGELRRHPRRIAPRRTPRHRDEYGARRE